MAPAHTSRGCWRVGKNGQFDSSRIFWQKIKNTWLKAACTIAFFGFCFLFAWGAQLIINRK